MTGVIHSSGDSGGDGSGSVFVSYTVVVVFDVMVCVVVDVIIKRGNSSHENTMRCTTRHLRQRL